MDLDALFDLASLTKPVATLTLLAQALSAPNPRLSLDDRLDRWLPDARGTGLGQATLGQLVSHTSGAPAWLDFWGATAGVHDPAERTSLVRARVLHTPLERPAGTAAVYSDLGYMSLGWVLEALHGEPLDRRFLGSVAAPLGLQAAFRRISLGMGGDGASVATEVVARRCPQGLALQGEVHDDNCAALDGVAGHAGLFATADDVLTWAQAWLRALRSESHRRVGPLSLAPQLVRHLVATPGVVGTTWRHGFDTPTRPGSSAGDQVPSDAFGHLGFTGTSVWCSPGRDLAVVMLANRVHPTSAVVEGIRKLRPALHDSLWAVLTR
jgi:CubicO group peptidase (beta-lactamase class C family)